MKIAVMGATGTAGSRTVGKLKERGFAPVEISRSTGVDLITGAGLQEALEGVDAAIDASNAFPTSEDLGLQEALTSATRNVVEACAAQQVTRLVFLSIIGVHEPVFDDFSYYVAKRAQENIVVSGPVRSTIVKSSQWHEFATNPAAVTFRDDEVLVQDWLVQPVAADAVADVLVETALDTEGPETKVITGPEVIRLPELTTRLLSRLGDPRPVHAAQPPLTAVAEGVLRAPEDAEIHPPDIDTWLQTREPSG